MLGENGPITPTPKQYNIKVWTRRSFVVWNVKGIIFWDGYPTPVYLKIFFWLLTNEENTHNVLYTYIFSKSTIIKQSKIQFDKKEGQGRRNEGGLEDIVRVEV